MIYDRCCDVRNRAQVAGTAAHLLLKLAQIGSQRVQRRDGALSRACLGFNGAKTCSAPPAQDMQLTDTQLTHLTALRELSLSHEASSMQFAARPFSLTVLPPSLARLRLRMPSDSVRLFPFGNPRLKNYRPGSPTVPTQLLQV